jgi:hypothetical protein
VYTELAPENLEFNILCLAFKINATSIDAIIE